MDFRCLSLENFNYYFDQKSFSIFWVGKEMLTVFFCKKRCDFEARGFMREVQCFIGKVKKGQKIYKNRVALR